MKTETTVQTVKVPLPGGTIKMEVTVAKKNYNKGPVPPGYKDWPAYYAAMDKLKPVGYNVNPRT